MFVVSDYTFHFNFADKSNLNILHDFDWSISISMFVYFSKLKFTLMYIFVNSRNLLEECWSYKCWLCQGLIVIWNLQEFLSLQDCGIFLSLQDFLVLQYN